jgi:hypothetical protein
VSVASDVPKRLMCILPYKTRQDRLRGLAVTFVKQNHAKGLLKRSGGQSIGW